MPSAPLRASGARVLTSLVRQRRPVTPGPFAQDQERGAAMTIADVETDRLNRLHSLAPPNRGDLNSTHVHGAHAPVEEPSTASKADKPEPTRMTPIGSRGSDFAVPHKDRPMW